MRRNLTDILRLFGVGTNMEDKIVFRIAFRVLEKSEMVI